MLGFGLPARGEVRDTLTTDAPFAPNAFLRIDRAGKVTFVMPVIEMGQGTYTSLPMLIAEELEVDVDKVAIEHSPPDDKVYANPLDRRADDRRFDFSSRDLPALAQCRRDGARHARNCGRAAMERRPVHLSRGERRCRARATGRKLGYGELVDAAAKLPVPEKVALKEPADFKLIGTPHRRLDTAGKVDGSAKFGIDMRLPGMKFAVVAHVADLRRQARIGRRSEGEGGARRQSGRPARRRCGDRRRSYLGGEARARGRGSAVGRGPNAKLSTADIVAAACRGVGKAGRGGAARRRCRGGDRASAAQKVEPSMSSRSSRTRRWSR